MPSQFSRRRGVAFRILFVAAAVVPFLLVWPRQFVNWDDRTNVVESVPVRYPTFTNVGYMFTHAMDGNYIPLTWLSHALDWQLWGDDAWGHGATNVVWHAGCCFLLVGCLRRGGMSKAPAWTAGMLFAVHPVHAENVAWVSGRKDLLCAAALLACQYSYMRWRTESRRSSRRWSLFWLIVAGLSKPTAMSAIVSLALYDTVWLRRTARDTLRSLLPHAAVCVIVVVIAVPAQYSASAIPGFANDRRWGAIDLVGCNLLCQLLRCWLPVPFSPFYPSSFLEDIPAGLRWMGAVLFVGASAAIALKARGSRAGGAAAWWWFGAMGFLLPVSGVVPLGLTSLADRYVYLPSAGPCVFVAVGVASLARRVPKLAYGAACTLILGLAVATHQRAGAWKDNFVLWQTTLRKFPRCPYAWLVLSSANYPSRQLVHLHALDILTQGLKYNPSDMVLSCNAAVALGGLGRYSEANAVLAAAEAGHPQAPEISFQKGKLALLQGRNAEALAFFQSAMERQSNRKAAYLYLTLVYERLNDVPAALAASHLAVELAPNDAKARLRQIELLRLQRRSDEALRAAEELTAFCPHDPQGWHTRVSLLRESGRTADAQKAARDAARFIPPEWLEYWPCPTFQFQWRPDTSTRVID